jgi:hypothetical protein
LRPRIAFQKIRRTKEAEWKLNLEIHTVDGVTVVSCTGRIAYRDEAVDLSETIASLLPEFAPTGARTERRGDD